MVFVLTHAQSVPPPQTDIVKEDVTQILTSWTADATLAAPLDSPTELMLPVLHNAQLDTFLMDQSANCLSKPAHQDNSTTLKMEFAPLVPTHVLNVNTPTHIVSLAQVDSPFLTTSVLNQTAVDQEISELLQDHAQLAHQNVPTVSVPPIVQHVLQVTFTTELIVF